MRQTKFDSGLKEQRSSQISIQIYLVYPNDFYINLTLAARSDCPKTS